jgi:hypothetical protein
MNDADHVTAETDEFTPRVHFLINPNDGSLCLMRGLISPGRSMVPHNQTTTSKLGRFFQEVGRSINQAADLSAPLPAEIQNFLRTAERYGYWMGTPEENSSAGISLF